MVFWNSWNNQSIRTSRDVSTFKHVKIVALMIQARL